MENETLNHILNHFLAKFKDVKSDQSPDLLQKLTLSQYKNLAQIEVEANTNLSKGLENYLSDHLEIVNLELQLKRKKCALGEKLKKLNTKFDEAIDEANKRNEQLKNGDIGFLNPKPVPEKLEFAKPTEPRKQIPIVEPTYSTRVLREPVSQQPSSVIDSVMKPPTFTSLAMSTRKEKKENVQKAESFNLDDSLINGNEISMVNISDERRRLQFDELDDDEQTPARQRVFPQKTQAKTPSRTPARPSVQIDRKPLDPYSLPPPPVFSSSTGRVFNQNRE